MIETRTARHGFTLIEVLIVLAMIVLLSAILVPVGLRQVESGRMKAAKVQLTKIQSAINLYQTDVSQLPESLRDLVTRPTDEEIARNWGGPYIKDAPKDPWGIAYQYQLTPDAPQEYELYSYGPKKKKAPQAEHISVWKD